MCGLHLGRLALLFGIAPSVAAVILMIFSDALSVSPRTLTNAVNFVSKGMSRIVNFDNWP